MFRATLHMMCVPHASCDPNSSKVNPPKINSCTELLIKEFSWLLVCSATCWARLFTLGCAELGEQKLKTHLGSKQKCIIHTE